MTSKILFITEVWQIPCPPPTPDRAGDNDELVKGTRNFGRGHINELKLTETGLKGFSFSSFKIIRCLSFQRIIDIFYHFMII